MISEQFQLPGSASPIINGIRELKGEGLTLSQIASRLNSNFETVRKICHEQNIIKPRSIDKRLSSGDKQSFRYKYLSGDFTNKQLAEFFGISVPSVKRLAKRMSLPKKYSNEYPKRKERMEKIAELYGKRIGTYKIGKVLGMDDETVRGYLKRMGIRRREVNGLTRQKITWQNRIIKEMYHSGAKLEEIEKKAKIGKHGIDKRLKAMGIERARHPYNPVGSKYDENIKELFLEGLDFAEIAKKLKIPKSVIPYRFKSHIFNDCSFKIKFYSKLSGRWKRTVKTYSTPREVLTGKKRLRKYISPKVRIKILPIAQRVKAKSRFLINGINENPILASAGI